MHSDVIMGGGGGGGGGERERFKLAIQTLTYSDIIHNILYWGRILQQYLDKVTLDPSKG